MTKRSWHELPANAKTIMDVQCCIDFLEQHHPYPANMQPDRVNFATARLGYESAKYQLEKFRCHTMAMSYAPKIEPVRCGKCTQTIRKGRNVSVGDEILFHDSDWNKLVIVDHAEPIIISSDSICFYDSDKNIQTKSWDSFWADVLAIRDYIVPQTGPALRDVLFGFYGVPDEPEKYQIIRW